MAKSSKTTVKNKRLAKNLKQQNGNEDTEPKIIKSQIKAEKGQLKAKSGKMLHSSRNKSMKS